jgi:hypothetical protein
MFPWWNSEPWAGGRALPGEFRYSSDTNATWLTKAALLRMMEDPAGVYAGR